MEKQMEAEPKTGKMELFLVFVLGIWISQNRVPVGGPQVTDYSIWRSIWGLPILWNYQNHVPKVPKSPEAAHN